MKKLEESQVMSMMFDIMDGRGYDWKDRNTVGAVRSLFMGFSYYLGKHKNKDTTVCCVLKDVLNKFHFAAYVQFIKNEEDSSDEGSWTLNFTYDEADVDYKNWETHNFPEDTVLAASLTKTCYNQLGIQYAFRPQMSKEDPEDGSAQEIFCTVMDTIKDYMRQSLGTDPVLELENYFTMTAEANGEKVYIGIEPSAILKQYVKDDAGIKEANEKLSEMNTKDIYTDDNLTLNGPYTEQQTQPGQPQPGFGLLGGLLGAAQ